MPTELGERSVRERIRNRSRHVAHAVEQIEARLHVLTELTCYFCGSKCPLLITLALYYTMVSDIIIKGSERVSLSGYIYTMLLWQLACDIFHITVVIF